MIQRFRVIVEVVTRGEPEVTTDQVQRAVQQRLDDGRIFGVEVKAVREVRPTTEDKQKESKA